MPHSVNGDDVQQQQDDDEIARLLNNETSGRGGAELDFLNRDLEVGEKADDAEDFEDIGDDDLASEEDEPTTRPSNDHGDAFQNGGEAHEEPGVNDSMDFGDDLFGDEDNAFVFGDSAEAAPAPQVQDQTSAPTKPRIALPGALAQKGVDQDGGIFDSPASYTGSPIDQGLPQLPTSSATPEPQLQDEEDEEELDEQVALQRALFARAGRRGSHEPPDAPQTDMELFFSIWPSYDPERTARFIELFPPAPGHFNWKVPVKPPKPLQPNKLSLEIAPDTERAFRLSSTATAVTGKTGRGPELDSINLIRAVRPQAEIEESGDEVDVDDINDDELVGGLGWQDIELACCDWEVASISSSGSVKRRKSPQADSGIYMEYDSDSQDARGPKRAKVWDAGHIESAAVVPLLPSLDDPEQTTQRLAKRVALDENDADLLIDESAPRTQSKRRTLAGTRGDQKDAARDITRRYNISNDEAYELLKENHQHKVRSTLGSVSIDHSMPAVKLQFPFYRVKLEPKQLRSFHRPALHGLKSGRENKFSKSKVVKKKHLKGRETRDIFAKSEDLSMGDNSSGLLLEYSEEMPMMLSNFGMGNRLVNYYRRKDDQDTSRPKEEIGETQVLLPQDRSPFANFGHVDPGELVPAIHNSLYRAPIFKHEGKPTDFLVVCSTISETHHRFYLRNLENLHVVGQQFPSTEIPGEHSRKVTDAAKRRLKAISYRVWRKWSQRRGPPLTNQVVLAHLPGSDIAQNRGKMREFMKYDKNQSIWVPKDTDIPPDTDELRSLIRPEDICLLDSMQVGVQHLSDLGLRRDEDAADDEDEKEGTNIELLLAPWSTTKNFMNACQGKAMLQLHGEGDPTGRGEGFSFIKTSMKGGFRALGESIEERLDAKRLKENHGHSYNVAKQQRAYDESIRRIWRAQTDSLSSKMEHSDTEVDIDDEPEDLVDRATTPRTSFGTPAFSRREDESVSQYSRNSLNQKNQTLVITRQIPNKYGGFDDVPITITNPRVISAYKRAKYKERTVNIDPTNIVMTGDKEYDAIQLKAAEEELARLHRNVDRRHARERAKGIAHSPSASQAGDDDIADGSTPHTAGSGTGKRGGRKKVNPEGTGRRCANCGQIGHIKTNKKYVSSQSFMDNAEDSGVGISGGGLEIQIIARRAICPMCLQREEQSEAGAGFGFEGIDKPLSRWQRDKRSKTARDSQRF
ncbi:Transcription initiation factor TFIid 111 kDa subunit-like protein [Elsinoe fawcettii]|nr:Transcription initiation factor TFIid 111 kDa subunit-like protein [Elsinoe fawcettii]